MIVFIPFTPEIIAENLLNRDFKATKIGTKWIINVTEMNTGNIL